MRNTDKTPDESTAAAHGRPAFEASSGLAVWEIPGDVPASRHYARADTNRVDAEFRNETARSGTNANSRPGAYDQRRVRPAILDQVLCTPLDELRPNTTGGRKRLPGSKRSLLGLAALLTVSALLGLYVNQHARDIVPTALEFPVAAMPQAVRPIVAEAQDNMEKPAVVEASAVQQVAVSASADKPAASPKVIRHVVKEGDTLWDLARQYIQDPFRYQELAEQSQIQNPDLIYPGQIVRIELASRNMG